MVVVVENSNDYLKEDDIVLGIGIALGVTYGILFDNLALGISFGVLFGIIAEGIRRKSPNKKSKQKV